MTRNWVGWAALVPVLALGAACGEDGPDAWAGCPSPVTGDRPVTLDVAWQGPWDDVAAPAVFERWDEAMPSVALTVRPALTFGGAPAALMGTAPPILTRAPVDTLGALADLGAIRPLDPCLDTELAALGDSLPGARELGVVDGRRWGVAGNVWAVAMLYDRALLDAAGVERPPETWDELLAAARSIRERTGVEAPVAGLHAGPASMSATAGVDPPAAVTAFARLAGEGLMLQEPSHAGPDGDLLPVGNGRAAMEMIHPGTAWAYGSALAEGQAPEADLVVAPLPGPDGPVVPVHGDVWVISASATDEQAAAATALLSWLVQPEQQAMLHPLTDLLPATRDAARHPATHEYWQRVTLLEDLWNLADRYGAAPAEWAHTPSAVHSVDVLAFEVAAGADLPSGWAVTWAAIEKVGTHPGPRAAAVLGCTFPAHEPPPALSTCTGS